MLRAKKRTVTDENLITWCCIKSNYADSVDCSQCWRHDVRYTNYKTDTNAAALDILAVVINF